MKTTLLLSLATMALACAGKTAATESTFEKSSATPSEGTPNCFCPTPPVPGNDASDANANQDGSDGSMELDAGLDGNESDASMD